MRWREIIVESVKQYEPMFTAFKVDGVYPPWVQLRIRSVENLLKRKDRVVWALRWERYDAADTLLTSSDQSKFAHDLNVSSGELDQNLSCFQTMMRDYFSHWLSLSVPAIDNLVFNRQSPEDIMTAMQSAEEEWKQSRNQIINHEKHYPSVSSSEESDDEDDDEYSEYDDYEQDKKKRQAEINKKGNIEKIIDFGNGWSWWNLSRTYCNIEGNAMGHCGNGPSAQPGDTVLSLRKDMGHGNFRPSLTFILHKDGMLGELKGRGNEKPNPRYHDMIAKLLLNPIIKGCDGGGYASENNFSVLDLPNEIRGALLKAKPELLSVYDRLALYEKNPTSKVEKSLAEAMETNLKEHDFKYKRIDFSNPEIPAIVIKEWSDRNTFISAFDTPAPLDHLKAFFAVLEKELKEKYCDEWSEAEEISHEARGLYFDEVFDAILDYSHDDFMIDGVHYKVLKDGSIQLRLSLPSYLNPASSYLDNDDEDDGTPILDRITNLDDTCHYENTTQWHEVGNTNLDEVGDAIANYCFEYDPAALRSAVQLVYRHHEDKNSVNYHSRHPDQLDFGFPEDAN